MCHNRKQVRIDLRDILGQPVVGGMDGWGWFGVVWRMSFEQNPT